MLIPLGIWINRTKLQVLTWLFWTWTWVTSKCFCAPYFHFDLCVYVAAAHLYRVTMTICLWQSAAVVICGHRGEMEGVGGAVKRLITAKHGSIDLLSVQRSVRGHKSTVTGGYGLCLGLTLQSHRCQNTLLLLNMFEVSLIIKSSSQRQTCYHLNMFNKSLWKS